MEVASKKVKRSFELRRRGKDRGAAVAWRGALRAVPKRALRNVGGIGADHPEDIFVLCVDEFSELQWDSFAYVYANELPEGLREELYKTWPRTEYIPF